MRWLALLVLVVGCGPKGPPALPGGVTPAAAPPLARGAKISGEVPFEEARYYALSLAQDEQLLVLLTTKIEYEDYYPTTDLQILDPTTPDAPPLVHWRSSLWESKSAFTAPHAGTFVLRIQNAQRPNYPREIQYTVEVR